MAVYTPNTYTLTVQSMPPTGLSVGSTPGDGGTTNYTDSFTYGTIVNLQAPAVSLPGYTFSQWMVNGVALTAGQRVVMPVGFELLGQFRQRQRAVQWPSYVAFDSAGNVYVSDTFNNRIQEFTSAGVYVTQWGSFGSGNGQFEYPFGVAVDSADNVYVADEGNNRIEKFTSAGVLSPSGAAPEAARASSQIHSASLSTVPTMSMSPIRATFAFRKFTSSGAYVTQWGGLGTGNGGFSTPTASPPTAPAMSMWPIRATFASRITSSGAYVAKWGSKGAGNGQFITPDGITADSAGNCLSSDSGEQRIQKFTSAGAYVTQWGVEGSGNGQYDDPFGITADGAGNLYVADHDNDRIQIMSQSMSQNILAVAVYTPNTSR